MVSTYSKSRRWIKRNLKIGSGRFEKVSRLAQQHGYLDGERLPGYPQALFPDRPDHRAEARSDVDASLAGHQSWIEERLQAGWHAITVFEELPVTVKRSSFYRFLTRHGLAHLARDAGGLRVVPEIVCKC